MKQTTNHDKSGNQSKGTGSRKKTGRPPLYKPEYCEEARKLCLLMGATDKDLAGHFGVSRDTIIEWKKRYPDFSDSIKAGKAGADMEVANAMYKSAVGFTEKVKKVVSTADGVEVIEFEQYFPPSFVAAFIWLKNRQPGHWRDKIEVHQTGLSMAERAELDDFYNKAMREAMERDRSVLGARGKLTVLQGGKADEADVSI